MRWGSTTRVVVCPSSGRRYSISTSRSSRIAAASVRDQRLLLAGGLRLGRVAKLELAERLLQLRPDAIERRLGVRRHDRPHELEREPDRPCLERRQPGRPPERVAEQLLLDPHLVAVEDRVHGVAAAAEVDEVEQLQVVVELVIGNPEAVDELRGGDHGALGIAAACEQVGQQCLQHREALGR